MELGAEVYETLADAGAAFDLNPAGYYAINSLRLDMGYRAFGTELTPDYTPVEAGLTFACDLEGDGDWIGRALWSEPGGWRQAQTRVGRAAGPRGDAVGRRVTAS